MDAIPTNLRMLLAVLKAFSLGLGLPTLIAFTAWRPAPLDAACPDSTHWCFVNDGAFALGTALMWALIYTWAIPPCGCLAGHLCGSGRAAAGAFVGLLTMIMLATVIAVRIDAWAAAYQNPSTGALMMIAELSVLVFTALLVIVASGGPTLRRARGGGRDGATGNGVPRCGDGGCGRRGARPRGPLRSGGADHVDARPAGYP